MIGGTLSTVRRSACCAAAAWILLGGQAFAEKQVTQFLLVGPIESFTLDSASDPLSSAKMKVHGVQVVLPRNLIIQFPAIYATPADAFDVNPAHNGKSGLAIDETPAPIAAFEASISGNIVTDTDAVPARRDYIAGLVNISQHSLATGSGYIRHIDADGLLHIVGDAAGPTTQTEALVRINDASQRFAPQDPNAKVDPRFNVDEENPTVTALTGYPMCVPKDGPRMECPASNRPVVGGKALTLFVMGNQQLPPPSPDAVAPIPACPSCDPSKQAPFVIGDFVTYSGKVESDNTGKIYISAFKMVANVGIFTAPGQNPAYVTIGGSLIGTMGPLPCTDPILNADDPACIRITQEAQDRVKIEGFTTDPSRPVEIYAVDVDATSGEKFLRYMETSPTQDVPLGRFKVIRGSRAGALFDADGTLKGAPRELLVRVENGPDCDAAIPGTQNGRACDAKPLPAAPKAANGLVPGIYLAPVEEFIFPENHVLGEPVVRSNFECMSWLLKGSGPLLTKGRGENGVAAGPDVGRLDPWPGLNPPSDVDCGPRPKV